MAENKAVIKPQTRVIASRQTAIDTMGQIGTLLNPDRVLEKLGISQTEAYKDLLTDTHLTTVRESRAAAVKNMDYGIERGGAPAKAAKMVTRIFENLDIDRFIDDVLLANDYGMAPIEIIWKQTENWYIPDALVGKPARWFQFDEQNRLRFISQSNMTDGVLVPNYKILLPRNRATYDNPYGDALLSKVYWPITWKRNGLKWWNVFVEKYAMPWIVVKNPPNMDETDADKLLDDLNEMVQDAVLMIPGDNSMEFKEPSGGRSSEIYEGMAKYMNAEISKVYLGQTLTTEIGDVGSYSASQTHQGVKDERRDADKLMIERTANQLIKWIWEINISSGETPKADLPYFKLYLPQSINKEQAERDKILSDIGVKFQPEYMKKTYNLDDNDFEMGEPTGPGEAPDAGGPIPGLSMFAKTYPDQESIDNAVKNIPASVLEKQANGILKPIIDLVNSSNSYDDVLDNLLDTFPEMDFDSLESMVKQAIFVSNVYGRIAANDEK